MAAPGKPRLARVLELVALVILGALAGYIVTSIDVVRLRGFDDALRTLSAGPTATWPIGPFLVRMIPTAVAATVLAWFAWRNRAADRSPFQRALLVLAPLFAFFVVITQDDHTRRAPVTALLLAA